MIIRICTGLFAGFYVVEIQADGFVACGSRAMAFKFESVSNAVEAWAGTRYQDVKIAVENA